MAQPLRCSTCGNQFDPDETPAMPFCSERCKQIDLGRWLDEEYGVPHETEDLPEDEIPPE